MIPYKTIEEAVRKSLALDGDENFDRDTPLSDLSPKVQLEDGIALFHYLGFQLDTLRYYVTEDRLTQRGIDVFNQVAGKDDISPNDKKYFLETDKPLEDLLYSLTVRRIRYLVNSS